MPLPDYSASVESTGLPGRPYPRMPDYVSPSDTGEAIGKGIEQAGDIEQHVYQQALQTRLMDAHNQFQTISQGLTHDPQNGAFTKQGQNAFGLDGQYLPQYDAQSQKVIDSLPQGAVQDHARAMAGQIRSELSNQLNTYELAQHQKVNVQTAKTGMELAQQRMESNYNDASILANARESLDITANRFADLQGFTPDMRAELLQQAHSQAHAGVLTNMIADGKVDMASHYLDAVKGDLKPEEVKMATRAIQAGQVDSAIQPVMKAFQQGTSMGQRALADMLQSGGLDLDQQSKAIAAVERQRADFTYAQRQKFDKPITALETSIAAGNVSPSAASQADAFYERGALDQTQHISMLDGIARAEKKQAADNGDLEYARDAYLNQRPMDPRSSQNKKAINLLFATSTIGVPPGSPGYMNTVGDIANKTGILPDGAVSWARASLMGGNPQAAAQAASLLDRVQRVAPNAYTEATDPATRALAESINSPTSSGADPEAAVELARENAKISKGARAQLTQAWNQQTQASARGVDHEALDANAIRQGLADDPHYATHSGIARTFMGTGVPQPPAPMAAEFNQLTHSYFLHTNGNLTQARQLALNDLKSTWGVTEVNGQRELMKYAPERMVPGLTADMVRDDLTQQFPGKDIHLTESPETGVTRGQVWNLSAKDEFGAYDIMHDSTGRALRWQLPEVTQAARDAQEKQDTQDRDRLVKEQEQRKELEANVMERHGYAAH